MPKASRSAPPAMEENYVRILFYFGQKFRQTGYVLCNNLSWTFSVQTIISVFDHENSGAVLIFYEILFLK
jgi:hypothetical protein